MTTRLAAHAAHHVERIHRATPQRQFQNVFLNALFQGLFQIVGDFEKPVGRAQAADALVRALVIIIFDPEGGPLHRLIEAVELGTLEEFVLDRLPESLDFAQASSGGGDGNGYA